MEESLDLEALDLTKQPLKLKQKKMVRITWSIVFYIFRGLLASYLYFFAHIDYFTHRSHLGLTHDSILLWIFFGGYCL